MNDGLVGRWNDSVADHDTVWVLGDVALGQIDHTLALVRRLAGHKQLLTGNHDRCWVGNGAKAEEWTRRYADAGFETIHQGEVVLALDGVDDLGPSGLPSRVQVTACHFPYRGDSQDDDRYPDHRPLDRGGWLLHGHVHERWRQWDRMINVGVDAWDYRPVSADVIRSVMAAGPVAAPIPCLGPSDPLKPGPGRHR